MLPSEIVNDDMLIDPEAYVAALEDDVEIEPDLLSVSDPIKPEKLVFPDEIEVVASYCLVPTTFIAFWFTLNVPVLKE